MSSRVLTGPKAGLGLLIELPNGVILYRKDAESLWAGIQEGLRGDEPAFLAGALDDLLGSVFLHREGSDLEGIRRYDVTL